MKGDHLAASGIHGHPNPRLVRFLLYEAGPFIRFHLEPLHHHDSVTGHGLNFEMIGQCLGALDQKTHEPLESDPHGTTNAPQRNSLEKQAINQCPYVIRDKVLLEALDKLASTVTALMVLLTIVDVAIFLTWLIYTVDRRLG